MIDDSLAEALVGACLDEDIPHDPFLDSSLNDESKCDENYEILEGELPLPQASTSPPEVSSATPPDRVMLEHLTSEITFSDPSLLM